MSDINPYQSPANLTAQSEGQPDADIRLYEAAQTLAQTKPWVRFLSVLGFIMSLFSIVGLIAMAAFINAPAIAATFTVATIMTAIVTMILMYLVPSILMWKYGNRIGSFLREQSTTTLAAAIAAQKALWMYVGVVGAIGVVYSVGASLLSVLG